MKGPIVYVGVVLLALVLMLGNGCLFGGGKQETEESGGGAPVGPTAEKGAPPGGGPGGPPMGGPGAKGGPAKGPGGPAPSGPEAGGAPAGAGAAPTTSAAGAVTPIFGKTSKEGINIKHTGDYNTALAIFEGNLQKNPKDTLALYGKAWILAEQGQRPEAIETFNKFLQLSKDRPKIKEARAAISRMKRAMAQGGGAPMPSAGGPGGAPSAPAGAAPGGPPAGGPGGPPRGGSGGPPAGGPGGPPRGGPGGPPMGGPGGPPMGGPGSPPGR